MSRESIDAYLAELDEPKRSTLAAVRDTITELLPDAEPCIAYGAPAFKIGGKNVAGFAAYDAACGAESDSAEEPECPTSTTAGTGASTTTTIDPRCVSEADQQE